MSGHHCLLGFGSHSSVTLPSGRQDGLQGFTNLGVEQIRSFIELQKLRFSEEDNIRIEFEIDGDMDKAGIAPMLLLPFVENAFKHGIRLSSPSHVSLRLTVNDGTIRFSVENSVHGTTERSAETDSALGLRNVKRRLELMYPDTHGLSIGESEGVYRVVLDLGPGSSKRS